MKPDRDSPEQTNRESSWTALLLFYGIVGVFLLLLWETPLVYPARLLGTFIHELGHLLTALLTGNEIADISVSKNLGGHVVPRAELLFPGLVISAGYMGCAFYAAFLFWACARPGSRRFGLALTGILLFAYLGAAQTFTVLTFLSFMAIWLIVILIRGWELMQVVTARVIAMVLCIDAIESLYEVLFAFDSVRSGSVWDSPVGKPGAGEFYTDATLMAAQYGGSEGMWATIWLSVAVLTILLGVIFSIRAQIKAEREAEAPHRVPVSLANYKRNEGTYTID